jgi:uncharacterized protein YdhG (YjbR/CyaY superfamily)
MDTEEKKNVLIDEYIEQFSGEIQTRLQKIRDMVHEEVPEAVESFSYKMPGFKLNKKVLLYFAGFTSHIGLYPTASVVEKEIPDVAKYRTGKGTLQFKNDQELPLQFIRKIIQYRMQESQGKKRY